jgi:hypothetical protein
MLSKNLSPFLRPLKSKDLKEESATKIGLYDIVKSTTLESNKSLYDLRDFLSYIGANVFLNKVQDVLVDNKQPFPRAHCAYWTNPSTWKAIIPRLP